MAICSQFSIVFVAVLAAACACSGAVAAGLSSMQPLELQRHKQRHVPDLDRLTPEQLQQLQQAGSSSHLPGTVPVKPAGGEYYLWLKLGSQDFPIMVDTGSSLFGVPSSRCVACATNATCVADKGPPCAARVKLHATPSISLPCPPPAGAGFTCKGDDDPTDDPTLGCGGLSQPHCSCGAVPPMLAADLGAPVAPAAGGHPVILQCYVDGSGWLGVLLHDKLTIAGYSADVLFVDKVLNIKDGEASLPFSGILGMAYTSLSGVSTPFERLVAQAGIPNLFTMCMNATGGTMTFGGGSGGPAPITWTPLIQESFYVVNMLDMTVGGKSVGVPSKIYNDGQAIVDSGTTTLVLPHTAYLALYDKLKDECARVKLVGICGDSMKGGLFGGYEFLMTHAQVAAFPDITVIMQGLTVVVPPQQYLSLSAGYYSLGIQDSGDDVSGTIMGQTVMMNYQVVFDRENKRVGFGSFENCLDH